MTEPLTTHLQPESHVGTRRLGSNGPLVSAIIKQGAQIGGRKLPVTIVPGELTEDEIEDLA